jgi:hypothetical protein
MHLQKGSLHILLLPQPAQVLTGQVTGLVQMRPPETLGDRAFGEIYAKGIHVHSVEKGGEALREPRQTLVHELQVHEVGFQVGHAVAEFCELVF